MYVIYIISMDTITIILIVMLLPLTLYVWYYITKLTGRIKDLSNDLDQEENKYTTLLSQKKKSEVRLGQITEHLVPFLDAFPYNPKRAQFLGAPIDFVVFETDEIIFVEVKTGKSRLTKGQKHIKNLVENKKVNWKTIRIS